MAVSGSGDGMPMQLKRNRPPPATSPPEVEHCLTPLRQERERRFSYKRKSGNHFSHKRWLLQIISSLCTVNLVHFSSPALFPPLLAHSICGEHPERKKKMERNTPVRKPHTSTADLLTWPETPPLVDPPVPDSAARRPHKPSGGISPALFGGPMTEEEAESVNKRKPSSGPKLKEMIGSGIFSTVNENDISELDSSLKNPNDRTSVKIYQQTISGISQISFSAEETVSPRKPTSLPEVAKQRELSGSLVSAAEDTTKKQPSDAKTRELSGHDIFGPPPEVLPRPLAARNLELKGQLDFGEPAPQSTRTPVIVPNPAGGQSNFMSTSEQPVPKTSKKISNQKFHDLTGNDIFKSDAASASAEKPLSSAKLKEMSGSDIFADGKAASREYFGGVRKPPGGGSSIALV